MLVRWYVECQRGRRGKAAAEVLHAPPRVPDDDAAVAMGSYGGGGDCEGRGAMLNFARHVFGYARYCPKMNA
jgi:hypothetical protein